MKIKVTYGQTEARAMLADINAFRTSETDAWCWDMSDNTKQPCLTTELEYDYELERVAMQRAAEIALSYDHTRPNGKACFTAYPSGYRGMGENIAAGYGSAAEVFDGWKEENEFYAGQGHRRNMLSAKFKAVGIGHVVYQGCHYWVQEFGDRVKNGAASGANDDTQIVDVDVASSYITAVKTNLDDVSLKVGEKATAADFSLALNVVNQWGYQKDCVIENECSAKIEDETIASLSDDAVITGLKSGTTKIWISNPFGSDFYRTITVTKGTEDKGEISVEPIADQTYTGSVLMPKVVVKAGSKVLTKNVDYTVSYSNNINVGTASVKITGKGSYKGSYTVNFKILPCAISKAGIRKIIDQRYNGNEIKPSVSLTYKYKTLKKGTDYTVSYSNNINAGTATVTITGIGSYEGTASTTFQIKPRSLREVTARKISTQEYTGQEITPKLNLTYKGKTLTENVDYVAVYSNNIEPGNGVVNIQGKGNFTEQRKLVFSIQRKNKPVENEDEEEDDDDQEEIIHTKTMKLDKTKIALKKGKTYRLKVKVNAGSTDSISFQSSNKKIATVSKKGVIKAKKAGKVRITVKSGNITRRCVVVVKSGK
ncbi:MAG: CAP domain-containing protein [Lachnospiraceae bacterium]|nr:CAP domain-containing protein [Lachnospiraceae bacterium]